jgi:hypothetical protein
VIDKEEGRPRPESAPTKTNLAPDEVTGSGGAVTSGSGIPPVREWRRRQFAHDLRVRRRISRELDAACGINRSAVERVHLVIVEVDDDRDAEPDVDYWGAATGMNLGIPERQTAGRALPGRWAA